MSPPTLTTIPAELILEIASHLRGIDIENVARTFNKTLTMICLPLIKHRIDWRRNRARMAQLFPRYDPMIHCRYLDKLYAKFGLEEEWGPFIPLPGKTGQVYLDYFDFDGSLSWLDVGTQRPDKRTTERREEYDKVGIEKVQMYEKIAKVCGFKLPGGFQKLLLNRSSLEAMFGDGAENDTIDIYDSTVNKVRWLKKSLWRPEGEEKPCPYDKDSEQRKALALQLEKETQPEDFAEGFVIMIAGDQQGCWGYHLFIGPTGKESEVSGYCVLGNPNSYVEGPYSRRRDDEDELFEEEENEPGYAEKHACLTAGDWLCMSLTKDESELGVRLSHFADVFDFRAHAYSFEEFLAAKWLDCMSWSADDMDEDEEEDPSGVYVEPLRQHLIDIYSTKGRKKGWIQNWRRSDAPEETE